MSFLMRKVAHCDICGHEWLTKQVPTHCAKCKSRKWNQEGNRSAMRKDVYHDLSETCVCGEKRGRHAMDCCPNDPMRVFTPTGATKTASNKQRAGRP